MNVILLRCSNIDVIVPANFNSLETIQWGQYAFDPLVNHENRLLVRREQHEMILYIYPFDNQKGNQQQSSQKNFIV